LQNNNTRTGNKTGFEVEMLRGVKHGDPLSPLLFNSRLDPPLLEEIEEKTEGISINISNKVSVLAFADDIILLGKNERAAQVQLDNNIFISINKQT
jgi:hypothetical protein